MWGSDQAASLGPTGLMRLVRDIRLLEAAMGHGKKELNPNEVPIMNKLRRNYC
jgi:N-acetylneuraminate synthase